MLKQIRKRNGGQDGFTIIEVMIVLAIAGLIMVVVFLAVPALQRSSRNNAISTDANNVLTAVGNFTSDNGGALPTTLTLGTNQVSITGAAGTNPETAKVDTGVAKVSATTSASSAITSSDGAGAIQLVTGSAAQCNSTDTALQQNASVSPRSYAVLYIAESGSGNIVKCVGD